MGTLDEIFIDNGGSVSFTEFHKISESMMSGYAKFQQRGVPGDMIALAMLGATINLFDLFEMSDELPDLLRSIASRIEDSSEPN